MERSPEETREIERHKYFLSEKRGYDVGWEFAEQDWEQHHAARWRREQLRLVEPAGNEERSNGACCLHESSPAPSPSAAVTPASATITSAASTTMATEAREAGNGHRHEHGGPDCQTRERIDATHARGGPLRRLLSRLFRQAS